MSRSATLDELLLHWQELRRAGGAPTVGDVCAEHPALADDLARRIAAFESMEAMLGLKAHATLPDHHAKPEVPAHLAERLRPHGYEILEVIDQGGMGVVYKATQLGLQRTVALKMIAGFRVGPKQLGRFRVEAEAVARLQHPHIVQIYDVGEVDGHSFFTMEFVEGGTLAHHLAAGPISPGTAAELVETLARAVHHAHTRGIVHRDLKPANILLSAECGARNAEPKTKDEPTIRSSALRAPHSALLPKVSDFGLAKRLGTDTDHTATGEVIGTPTYMAPEQAEGRTDAIGPACDVYALGAILYESLTGRPPFRGQSLLETLRQVIANEPEAPRRIRSAVPRHLEAICLKCLEKNPARRYVSAETLADDLRRFTTGEPVVARRLSHPGRVLKWVRRRPVWAGAMALVVVVLVAFAGRGYAEREGDRKKIEAEQERKRLRAVEIAPQAREILQRHCYECHGANPATAERKFLVLDRGSLFDPDRKNVVPGHPEASRLLHRIEDNTMPPESDAEWLPRVSELELSIVRDWIAGGAPEFPPEDPRTPTPAVVPRSELAVSVYAIFVKQCANCHQLSEAGGGIKVLNHNLLLARKVVIPGRPEESELYHLLVTENETKVMPKPSQPRLTPAEIESVRQWIAGGAPPFPHAPKK
ncbi:protein kinase [Gemmata sp. G18]|uniref:Protein kinase n=1 Tax=Gemmata palustris TaxID=2822762 RepID=A0ABS5BLT9_9BACT|nr:protein kinase [Gemmata palustris]MBP3953863.1 protein kinase [Gemmata palustris]